MTDLPTTSIGLIAFIVVAFGFAVKYLADQNRRSLEILGKQNTENTQIFMTYIEKKNGNLERTSKLFTEAMEDQAMRHKDAMINQNDRHKQMMDDFAARLENLVPKNPRV